MYEDIEYEIATVDVHRLSSDHILSVPVNYDWSEGYPEQWDYVEAVECEDCGAYVIDGDDHVAVLIPPEDDDEDQDYLEDDCPKKGDDFRDMWAEGPMMSYYYPCDVDRDDAYKLVYSPLCIVEFSDGSTGIALTGGGMDLSWEICEAYILLGYLPPTHFVSLPRMAGMRATRKNLKILEACKRSVEVESNWILGRKSDLDHVEEWLKGHS